MILTKGEILESSEADRVLALLPEWIGETVSSAPLEPECVIAACDTLAKRVSAGEYASVIRMVLSGGMATQAQIDDAITFFNPENLHFKLKTELGSERFPVRETPPGSPFAIERRLAPLGVLLHIAAGNVDALPAYSVVEGLLTGNINLLKLPQADAGLSILLLSALTEIEPKLKSYIYVFDTPSSDWETLKKLAGLADGIAVWGGDEAVSAARRLAPLNTKIIEWGHKLSFAYATAEASEEALTALAKHMVSTKQLLCSSCQGIFLDTESLAELHAFCERFLPILDREAQAFPTEPGIQARITLEQYTERLEQDCQKKVFSGKCASVTAEENHTLALSLLYGNCWAKRLPRNRLVTALKPCKGHLQTAGLLCGPDDWEPLSTLLRYAGITRIRTAANLSIPLAGEAHDGEFALRRYTRIIETEML